MKKDFSTNGGRIIGHPAGKKKKEPYLTLYF